MNSSRSWSGTGVVVVVAMLSSLAASAGAGAHDSSAGKAVLPAKSPIVFGATFDSSRAEPEGVVAGRTWNVQVGSSLTFTPSALTILIGDTVKWTWAGSNHTVTSGSPCVVDNQYCSPSDSSCATAATSSTNATYFHLFNAVGVFPYFCRIHCSFGMTGTVTVIRPSIVSAGRGDNGHFLISGKSLPNISGTLTSTPDLGTAFGNPQPITTDATGAFQYDDATTIGATQQFYRVTF